MAARLTPASPMIWRRDVASYPCEPKSCSAVSSIFCLVSTIGLNQAIDSIIRLTEWESRGIPGALVQKDIYFHFMAFEPRRETPQIRGSSKMSGNGSGFVWQF